LNGNYTVDGNDYAPEFAFQYWVSGWDEIYEALGLTYTPPPPPPPPDAPTVTAVGGGINGAPTGVNTGGYLVGIAGTGLDSVTSVNFGDTPAVIFPAYGTYDGTYTLTVLAPAGTDGTVDVTVTNPAGTSPITSADEFTYADGPIDGVDIPAVTGLSPSSGSAAGGDTVVITATGFQTDEYPTVWFGTEAVPVYTWSSGGTMTVTTPPGTGTVDVTVVTSRGGTSATSSADQFTYE
jgi:hypothetical protein